MIADATAADTPGPSEHNDSSYIEVISSSSVRYSEPGEGPKKNGGQRKRPHTGLENTKSKEAKFGCSSVDSGSKEKNEKPVTLLEVLSMGRAAMEVVIDDWIQAYMVDRDSCLLDLIGFFIQCCGCKGVITAEMCENKEESHVKQKLVEKYDEDSGLQYKKVLAFPWILTVTWPTDKENSEYPLIQTGPYGRWFHADLSEFLSVFVTQCQQTIIFDGYLMNSVLSLLSELSNSYIVAFRHTCTLAAVKVLSSLIAVAEGLQVAIKNAERQQKGRKFKRQRSSLLRTLRERITRLQENKAEVEGMMDVVFKVVFLKRYRDIHPEIRCICMEEFGVWLKTYSSVFLNDSYLKYLGWALYDKVAEVRLRAVVALQRLCEDPRVLPELDLFSSRFKGRIISMTLDKDHEVSLQTMKLLVIISRTSEDFLTPVDYKKILNCVYASHRPLAAAAGELLFSWLLKTTVQTDKLNKAEAQRQQMLQRLKALVQFHLSSKLHTHVVYLVDGLWDCAGALLKDWPAITSILLSAAGLSQKQKAVLAEILVASVHQAAERRTLPGRIGPRKAMTIKDKRVRVSDCNTLTQHFLQVLPQLLSKFSSCPSMAASLMSIPQFLNAASLTSENTQLLSSVLSEMEAVLKVQSHPDVLEAAARSFLSLCEEQEVWSAVASPARDSLVQSWVDQLSRLLTDSVQGDSFTADKATTSEISRCLKRLQAFYNCHDLSRWHLWELLSPLLPTEHAQTGPPAEILLEVLQCCCFSLLWSLCRSDDTLTPSEAKEEQLLQLAQFCEQCCVCLSHSDCRVKKQSFLCVCDVLAAHSSQLRGSCTPSSCPLPYRPRPELQAALVDFARANIFVDSQSSQCKEGSRAERLGCRRRQLVALCRLIVDGVLETHIAAQVLMFYVKFHSDLGDIIRETILRTKRSDEVEGARMMAQCLQQLFTQVKRQHGGKLDSQEQAFGCVKELARRFTLLHGDHHSPGVASIHRMGLDFALRDGPRATAPPNIDYLLVLTEFSCKLSPADKTTILSHLQELLAEFPGDLTHHSWNPVGTYRTSLLTPGDHQETRRPEDAGVVVAQGASEVGDGCNVDRSAAENKMDQDRGSVGNCEGM
ncbi:cohesin subunit SA-2 isoform X1 [Synchiropus splendidus]|uniref:cohesin subunit SA-2 isoform X1 n=1 Tax=Synchiropus splendidus TaxID=270530 RepID=UPI00237D5571|nr:cohesin subunit SA-2 isoform X1 [Synchiropus splendidus]